MCYHKFVQQELDKRPQFVKPKVGMTEQELLELARRALPVYNRFTGERV